MVDFPPPPESDMNSAVTAESEEPDHGSEISACETDPTEQPMRSGPIDHSAGLLKQPETRAISQEQLVAEVKGIYAGLAMIENKCMEVVERLAAESEDTKKLSNGQWQALIALHRTLLHEHHDFFLASQHPSASAALRKLAAKYDMPARMWRHGIHSFLELMRLHLPHTLDHMLTFIYTAYSLIALLYETVPAFEDTWVECLGDLGRYRMAIEDDDMGDREVWAGVARAWYSKAAERAPQTDRLHDRLAVLARTNSAQSSGVQSVFNNRGLHFYTEFPKVGAPVTLLDGESRPSGTLVCRRPRSRSPDGSRLAMHASRSMRDRDASRWAVMKRQPARPERQLVLAKQCPTSLVASMAAASPPESKLDLWSADVSARQLYLGSAHNGSSYPLGGFIRLARRLLPPVLLARLIPLAEAAAAPTTVPHRLPKAVPVLTSFFSTLISGMASYRLPLGSAHPSPGDGTSTTTSSSPPAPSSLSSPSPTTATILGTIHSSARAAAVQNAALIRLCLRAVSSVSLALLTGFYILLYLRGRGARGKRGAFWFGFCGCGLACWAVITRPSGGGGGGGGVAGGSFVAGAGGGGGGGKEGGSAGGEGAGEEADKLVDMVILLGLLAVGVGILNAESSFAGWFGWWGVEEVEEGEGDARRRRGGDEEDRGGDGESVGDGRRGDTAEIVELDAGAASGVLTAVNAVVRV